MLLSDDVVEVVFPLNTTPVNVTITLPNIQDASGRSYRVAKSLVKDNEGPFTVTVTGAGLGGGVAANKVFAITDKFVGETFTASCNALKTVCSWVQANAAGIVPKTSTYTATTSDTVIHVDTTAGNVTVNLYTQVGNAGKKLRIANVNGANNVIVDGHSTEEIINASNVSATTVTVLPGRSVNLIVASPPTIKWKDQAVDIQTVTLATTTAGAGTAPVGADKTVVNVDATAGNITITLPAAADRFGKSTIGPVVFVSKVDKTANTVTVSGTGATSATLTAPGTVSFRANSSSTWVNTAVNKAETTVSQTGTGDAANPVLLVNTNPVIKITATTHKHYRLPLTAAHLLEINNTGTGDATIYAAANKKLFTSGGYVPSVTITSGRSSAFSYSAGLNAWVKV
jgi:hypothetical protein